MPLFLLTEMLSQAAVVSPTFSSLKSKFVFVCITKFSLVVQRLDHFLGRGRRNSCVERCQAELRFALRCLNLNTLGNRKVLKRGTGQLLNLWYTKHNSWAEAEQLFLQVFYLASRDCPSHQDEFCEFRKSTHPVLLCDFTLQSKYLLYPFTKA